MPKDCPDCNQPLVYDEYTDHWRCIFCNHTHKVSQPASILDLELTYSEDDLVDYGDYIETW